MATQKADSERLVVCSACAKAKPSHSFYADSRKTNGLKSNCKDCGNESAKRWKKRNPGVVRDRDRIRRKKYRAACRARERAYRERNVEAARAKNRRWRVENPILSKQSVANYRSKNWHKYTARVAVRRALESGRITKGACEVCGAGSNIHAHHDDYDKPLDVRWLCRKHHGAVHRIPAAIDAALRGEV